MLLKSVYRSYTPTWYYVFLHFIFYTTIYNYANVPGMLFMGL